MAKNDDVQQLAARKLKASFHLPTETNPNPQDNQNRYPLIEEIAGTVQEIEDEWGGSSFEGFYVPGSGMYRMQVGPLKGTMVPDVFRRFFVIFDENEGPAQVSKLEQILERFRKKTDKKGAPLQESIYLEVAYVEVRLVGEKSNVSKG